MLDRSELDFLLRSVQAGVVARRQLLELGATDNDIERMVRRRDLSPVHPGVYVDHTGPLTRLQREWAGVQACWPAALARESALWRDKALSGAPPDAVQVAVADWRRLVSRRGVEVHPIPHFEERILLIGRPPLVLTEHALVDVMEARLTEGDVAAAFAALARVCFSRRATPGSVERALAERPRVTGRRLIAGMVSDQRDGVCSVLERGYLHDVERPHGLPRGERQARSRSTGKATDQDVRYPAYGVIVELDGRGYHDNPDAWDGDATRDLAELAVAAALTARVTYGLVFRNPCRTAAWIAMLLRRNGWPGPFRRCPRCPRDLPQPV